MDVAGVLLYSLIGVLFGVITGLIPGIHVNNIALIALVLYRMGYDPIMLSSLIVGNIVSHTFLDFIPSTFLGAPAEDTALSVLPAHRLLLKGRGYRAVYLSAIGSLLAMIYSLPLMFGFQILFTIVGEENLAHAVPLILFAIVLYLLYLESKKGLVRALFALYVFTIAGVFGLIALNMPQNGNYIPVDVGAGLLFPIFTGLFGFPTLILSTGTRIPEQKIEDVKIEKEHFISSFYGTLSGSLVGFLPGITSGIAGVVARIFCREDDSENYIVTLGSVNTANAMLNMAALFIILHPRSRAVGVIEEIAGTVPWVNLIYLPDLLMIILLSAYFSSIFAFFLTLFFGRMFARITNLLSKHYGKISIFIMLVLVVFVILFSGPLGLIVAGIATLIGLLPPKLGVMRVHLMSVILLPVMVYYLGI